MVKQDEINMNEREPNIPAVVFGPCGILDTNMVSVKQNAHAGGGGGGSRGGDTSKVKARTHIPTRWSGSGLTRPSETNQLGRFTAGVPHTPTKWSE